MNWMMFFKVLGAGASVFAATALLAVLTVAATKKYGDMCGLALIAVAFLVAVATAVALTTPIA